VCGRIGEDIAFIDKAESSWYKFDAADIVILRRPGRRDEELIDLSQISSVVHGLKDVNQTRIYVPYEKRIEARAVVEALRKEKKGVKR